MNRTPFSRDWEDPETAKLGLQAQLKVSGPAAHETVCERYEDALQEGVLAPERTRGALCVRASQRPGQRGNRRPGRPAARSAGSDLYVGVASYPLDLPCGAGAAHESPVPIDGEADGRANRRPVAAEGREQDRPLMREGSSNVISPLETRLGSPA